MIPKKCKAGFQERKDTYSGKLAYVIYYDEKNTLRKETSWNRWRNDKIEALDFDNVPTKGFFVNKDAGGYKSGWDFRQTYCRIYDPRGFEIEITIPNLIYILKNVNCLKEKGFDGEFVYGWDGTQLLLVPTEAPEYKDIKEKTAAVYDVGNISAKNLVVGHTYANLEGNELVYLGSNYKYSYESFFIYDDKYSDIGHSIYSIRLEQPNIKIKVTKSTKKYFWFYNKEIKDIVAYNSLAKKIYFYIDKNVSKDLALYTAKLNTNKNYSKILYEKDTLVYYTFDEFVAEIAEKGIRKYLYDDKGKTWYIRSYGDTDFIVEGFKDQKFNFQDKEAILKVFTTIKPVKAVIHTLENGLKYMQLRK